MTSYYLTAYPWDLVDEGLDRALDRVQAEIGVTGVAVWVASPPVTQLRLGEVRPRIFRTRGGLFFKPDESRYEATRLKPVVSTWLKSRDVFARIAEGCARRGLLLRALVSASQTGRLAEKYPAMACKNVFGDESHSSLCLVHPDVRAYLLALVGDLASGNTLAGMVLTDWAVRWSDVDRADLICSVALGTVQRHLLGTCFCESCRQGAFGAGVDVEAAHQTVASLLQDHFQARRSTEATWREVLADHPPLADFIRFKAETLTGLLRRLMEACPCEVIVRQDGDGAESDPAIPHAVSVEADRLKEVASLRCAGDRPSELHLPLKMMKEAPSTDLVAFFREATELGFSAITVDDYGSLTEEALGALRKAIRFARRSAGE
jgi:hypothetical protein